MDVVALFDIPDIGYSRQFTSIPCLGGCGALNGGWHWLPHCFPVDACKQQILAKPSCLLKRRSEDSGTSQKPVEHSSADTDQP